MLNVTRRGARPAIQYLINKRFTIKGFDVHLSKRSRRSAMGRFGGGWQWKVGFMAGGRTVIISLLVMDVRITAPKRVRHAT